MTTTLGPDVVEHVVGAAGRFSLRLASGSVDLTGVDGDTVRVRDLDGHPLTDRFEVDATDGALSIRIRDGIFLGLGFLRGGPGRASARLSVELPRAAGVSIEGASASVEGRRLDGEQRYRSASGELRLTEATGMISLDNVSGDVEIDASGDLALAVRVVSGDVRVRGGSLRSAAVSTTSGDLEIASALSGPGPYSLQTVSGDAVVRGTGAGGVRIEARTLTGSISAAGGQRSSARRGDQDVVIGDGRTLLSFKSISGDLRVADADAAGPIVSPIAPQPPAVPSAPPAPSAPEPPYADEPDPRAEVRLAILRDLEEGRIDVGEATDRLAALDGEDSTHG